MLGAFVCRRAQVRVTSQVKVSYSDKSVHSSTFVDLYLHGAVYCGFVYITPLCLARYSYVDFYANTADIVELNDNYLVVSTLLRNANFAIERTSKSETSK